MDDNRVDQQPNQSQPSLQDSQSGGIFDKDAARWLRQKWPHRPMTTGGLPDECFEPSFQPTRKDVERWLVEYAEFAMPIKF